MKKYPFFAFFAPAVLVFYVVLTESCLAPDNFPVEPLITGVWFDVGTARSLDENFVAHIAFQDGDGDLGKTDEHPESNVFVIDSRDSSLSEYTIPVALPVDLGQDVSGEIKITLNECCQPGIPCSAPGMAGNQYTIDLDTVYYRIVLRDRAGNLSDTIDSPKMLLRCR